MFSGQIFKQFFSTLSETTLRGVRQFLGKVVPSGAGEGQAPISVNHLTEQVISRPSSRLEELINLAEEPVPRLNTETREPVSMSTSVNSASGQDEHGNDDFSSINLVLENTIEPIPHGEGDGEEREGNYKIIRHFESIKSLTL